MDFLNNDLVRDAEEKYGADASDAAEAEAEKFIGKDAATAAVGELDSVLGITRHANAPAAPAAGTPAATSDDDATASTSTPATDDN